MSQVVDPRPPHPGSRRGAGPSSHRRSGRRRPSSSRRCAGSSRARRRRRSGTSTAARAPIRAPASSPATPTDGSAAPPILGSVPASRRRMLAWWRTKTSAASATPSQTASGRPKSAEPERGRGGGDQRRERGDSGRRRRSRARSAQAARPAGQASASVRPRKVATPLPPRKPQPDREEVAEEGGEARDHRRRLAGERPGDAAPPTAPLPASRSSVAAAAALLPVRSTLVAPMLPEPMARRSPRPSARVISTPNGIEPSR